MKLYDHQRKVIDDDPKMCGLFFSTGSGKTTTALCLARGKTLVIVPKTQAEDQNWQREAKKLNLTIDLTVLSKETFKRYVSIGAINFDYETVIVDEAHTALGVTPNIQWVKKQAQPKASQLYNQLKSFIQQCKPKRLYLVTATIIRSPMTVWAASQLLGRDWDFYKWRNNFYFRLPMPGREVWTPKNDSATKDKLARIVRSLGYTGRLTDYFDVPDQTYKTIYLELTEAQKKRMKELPLEYPDPLVLLGKKHQVENGILAGDEFKAPELFDNQKIDKLLEFGMEFPRMVIFVKYTAQIAQIATAFEKEGRKVFILDGSTKDRGAVIKEANETENGVFIAQAQVSAGWELPEWPVMIFASMSYSVVDRIQGEGRILRANALKKNLYIDLVVRGGVDNAVHEAIINKQDFNERIYLNL